MRVLVAGGAGFIGSHVCEELLRRGHEAVCIDSLVTGRRANVAPLEARPGFAFVRSDVTQAPAMRADLVLHLASPASPVHYQQYPIETMLANSAGTHRLLEIVRMTGARFVFASTSEVYGDPLEHPQRETYWGNVNPTGPRACYDESKRFGEALTVEFRRKHGVSASIVRIFNTYGPRLRPADGRVVSNFLVQAIAGKPLTVYGDGSQTRSLCYVDDLIRGLYLLATSGEHLPVNIGNPDHEVTMLELAQTVIKVTGSTSEIVFEALPTDDPQVRRPDITRARQVLGWQPEVDLEEGLTRWLSTLGREPVRS